MLLPFQPLEQVRKKVINFNKGGFCHGRLNYSKHVTAVLYGYVFSQRSMQRRVSRNLKLVSLKLRKAR